MSYIRASKTVTSEAARSTVHASKTVTSEATRSTAHGSSKASNVYQEGSSAVSCCSTSLFTSEDPAFIQVKRKMIKYDAAYKKYEDDKLLEEANEYIHVETILSKFDHYYGQGRACGGDICKST